MSDQSGAIPNGARPPILHGCHTFIEFARHCPLAANTRQDSPARGIDWSAMTVGLVSAPSPTPHPRRPVHQLIEISGVPNGIRTRVTNVKGWCPRPLDDGDEAAGF